MPLEPLARLRHLSCHKISIGGKRWSWRGCSRCRGSVFWLPAVLAADDKIDKPTKACVLSSVQFSSARFPWPGHPQLSSHCNESIKWKFIKESEKGKKNTMKLSHKMLFVCALCHTQQQYIKILKNKHESNRRMCLTVKYPLSILPKWFLKYKCIVYLCCIFRRAWKSVPLTFLS